MTKIKYKQDNIDALMTKLNKISNSFSNLSNTFAPMKNSSLIGEGMSAIANNTTALGDRASGNSYVVSGGKDSFTEGELKNEQLLESIEIP